MSEDNTSSGSILNTFLVIACMYIAYKPSGFYNWAATLSSPWSSLAHVLVIAANILGLIYMFIIGIVLSIAIIGLTILVSGFVYDKVVGSG